MREIGSVCEQTLVLWHLLSLDAPSVVVAWCSLVAATRGRTLSLATLVVTFGAVWLVYVVDRLLDTRAGRSGTGWDRLERRHLFCALHRRTFLGIGSAVLLLLLALLHTAAAALVPRGTALAVALAAWFALVHLAPAGFGRRLPKELAAGIFFAVTVFAPARGMGLVDRPLLLPAIFFAALCTLNGVFIAAWEQEAGEPARHLPRLAPLLGTALLLGAAALLGCACVPALSVFLLPTALSAGLLAVLDRRAASFRRTTLRAAADLVLLTPLLLLPWLALWRPR